MKRTALKRKTPLASKGGQGLASAPLKRSRGLQRSQGKHARARRETPAERARREVWQAPHRGACQVCGASGWLVRHHVVLAQRVRAAGGNEWDLLNALELGAGCDCHERHHNRGVNDHRIPLTKVPGDAIDFAARLLGAGAAYEYLRRRYAGDDPRLDALIQPTEEVP